MKQIDVLPDDVLLEIFDFYTITDPSYGVFSSAESNKATKAWQLLVHVCRRWRSLVLGSPRRLNLRLYCTSKTPIRDTLDVWPALPLIVEGEDMSFSSDTDNTIAALEQSNRVCQISLTDLPGWQLEEVLAAMQVPFPELTYLRFSSFDETPPAIPDSFLGGSAPRLRHLELFGIPFLKFPKLLSSATHLGQLCLSRIPHSGYISPEAIVALFPVLSSLEVLFLDFKSPESRPDSESRSLPPPKRSILPVLKILSFRGVAAYLEELVTHIDTPRLSTLNITFFNEIDFHCPRLAQFFNYTPTLRACDDARVHFSDWSISVLLLTRLTRCRDLHVEIEILCGLGEPDRQLSSLAQVCNPFHVLSTVEDLYIKNPSMYQVPNDAIDNTLWLQLFASIYYAEESPPVQGICAGYRGRPARARWGQNNRRRVRH
jgi:hypothetical protein